MITTKHAHYDLYNDTDQPKALSFTIDRLDDIIDHGDNYNVAITRFYIPSSLIAPFVSTSFSTDYKVGFCFPSINQNTQTGAVNNLYSLASFPINNNNDFIDNLNKTMAKSFYDCMRAVCNDADKNYGEIVTVNQTITFPLGSLLQTFSVSTTNACNGKYGIKLTINNINCLGTIGALLTQC